MQALFGRNIGNSKDDHVSFQDLTDRPADHEVEFLRRRVVGFLPLGGGLDQDAMEAILFHESEILFQSHELVEPQSDGPDFRIGVWIKWSLEFGMEPVLSEYQFVAIDRRSGVSWQ